MKIIEPIAGMLVIFIMFYLIYLFTTSPMMKSLEAYNRECREHKMQERAYHEELGRIKARNEHTR